ncbi:hypothetical protein GQX73_g10362 [Xylaria multiplex]|uniref:AB hydrolase-1 domain-containing protein n=1 Tax=Xylaria multiplex TaxID=323545 RepID=A0A7C8MQS2_9PEZI|nr:hypothetical protein GQX73_g10362 [Xylaria multiplex]
MAISKPTVFFLPGGYHTTWIYDSVRSILSDRGFATEASDLVSVGTTDASVGMHSDAVHLRSQLTKLIDDGKDIVLVAHSYGGIVASNAVHRLSVEQRAAQGKQGGIALILYLAGLVVPSGRTLLSIAPPSPSWDVTRDDFLMPKDPLHNFYADVEPLLASKAIDALKPMSPQVLKDEITYEPWNQGFNVGYIFTEDDNQLPIETQQIMFTRFPGGSFSANLASGHSPFLNIPGALADVIQDGINFVLKKKHSA